MKFTLLGSCLLVLVVALAKPAGSGPKQTTLIVAGDFLGSLSPCGCTKPMVGGVRRWAKAVSSLKAQGECTIVVNGGLVEGTTRQDELKAESLAEVFRGVGAVAINLTLNEAKLGRGVVSSIHRLSGNAVTTTSLEPSETVEAVQYVESGPFLISGVEPSSRHMASVLGAGETELDKAVEGFVQASEERSLAPVLLFAGNEEAARGVAKKFPKLAAIVFRSSAPQSGSILREGQTSLLSPGEKGREIVSATWNGTSFERYQVVSLGPDIADDEEVARTYSHYLERVDSEKLLDAMPRTVTKEYAGSAACFSCHAEATKVWKTTAHAHALKTLESDGHGTDPDCVGCHVVGLGSESGFMSRATTPKKADVGCESCHGPAADHVMNPRKNPLPHSGASACMKCHDRDHSPKFDFSTYWPKIKH